MNQMERKRQSKGGIVPPKIIFGTYKLFEETEECVKKALLSGCYQGLDCAPIYRNQKKVGQALRNLLGSEDKSKVIKRDGLWIQTKLWRSTRVSQVVSKVKGSLKELGLEYVDCYLMHWPGPGRYLEYPPVLNTEIIVKDSNNSPCPICEESFSLEIEKVLSKTPEKVSTCPREWKDGYRFDLYKEMELCKSLGFARSLGVCNVSVRQLNDLLRFCDANNISRPKIVQNEFHPFLINEEMLSICKLNDISFQAHSSLGGPSAGKLLFTNSTIQGIALKYNKTPAQILFRWSAQKGCSIIPKSSSERRIIENAMSIIPWDDWLLTGDDICNIDHLASHVKYPCTGSSMKRTCMYSWLREHDPDHYF